MTSSLRNSLHRRNHKERSQLAHRAKYGILEKHKDYILRARDYHSKKDRITRLKQKAADKNKDEFYFAMKKEKTVSGVHVKERGNQSLSADMVKVLKTQDEGYVRTMRANGLKKIAHVKSQLATLANLVTPDEGDIPDEKDLEILREARLIPPAPAKKRKRSNGTSPKHILFAESEEQAKNILQKPSATNKEDVNLLVQDDLDLGWKVTQSTNSRRNRKAKVSTHDDQQDEQETEGELDESKDNRKRLLQALSARLTRDTQLRYAQRELEMQRLLMGKGGRRKLKGVEEVGADKSDDDDEDKPKPKTDEKTYKPRIYKWRLERKR